MTTTVAQDAKLGQLILDNVPFMVQLEGSPDMDFILEYIGNEFDPEDVFSEGDLSDWAERNGYVKE